MSEPKSTSQRINLKALLWDGGYLLAVICAITFAVMWATSSKELAESQIETAKLEQSQEELKEDLAKKLTEISTYYSQNYKEVTNVLSSDIQNKEDKIDHLKKDLVDLNQQKNNAQQRWREPLILSLETVQDIYAMKWESNSRVLSDMENHSVRTLTVCRKWEELCESLSPYPELAPQVAKLRIRLAQAYSGMGMLSKIDLSKINWKAAQMEKQKPEIEARIWFSTASQLARTGNLKQAQEYLEKAKAVISQMKATPEKATYFSAMMNLLEADIAATTNPAKSLEFYVKASDDLEQVVTAVPTNTKLRTSFIQACLDGAMLSEGGTSSGQAEKLRKRAFKSINTLLTEHPEIEKPHLLYAEVKILEAEEKLREGEHYKAAEILKVARNHIKEGGGSVLLTAEADGSQAFIHWDHGERTKAMGIIDDAIGHVTTFKEAEPLNPEADYRLASLYWVRSSMQISPADSIADGQKAVEYLISLVKQGAGKREASARRMIAIIYGDIGHQAYSSDQKAVAKQYFEQAKLQWDYLTKNWGECDEYKEGERWCTWRINSL